MRRVTAEVNLQKLDINVERAKKTAAGCVLLAVKDKEKARILTNHLRSVIGNDAPVYTPTRTTPVIVLGISDWMDQDQVIYDIRAAVPDLKDTESTLEITVMGEESPVSVFQWRWQRSSTKENIYA
jgi:hypothetical protein